MTTLEFEQLVIEHQGKIGQYVRTLCPDRGIAEDVLQETWMAAWKGRTTIHWRSPVGLLRTIAKRRLVDYWRHKNQSRDSNPMKEILWVDTQTTEVETFDHRDDGFSDHIYHALEALPPLVRECVLGIVVEGYTHQEMADRLGIPLGTALSRLARGREKLRKQLRAHYENQNVLC